MIKSTSIDPSNDSCLPRNLKPSLKTIIRQDALVIDDSKPVIKKQLSFPDDLPHYHETKLKPGRLRRALSGKSRNGSAKRKIYTENFDDEKKDIPSKNFVDFHHFVCASRFKARSSSAISEGERNPKSVVNNRNQRVEGGSNSTAKRSISSRERDASASMKRSLSVTDISLKCPVNVRSGSAVRKKESSSPLMGKGASVKTGNKLLVKQLSLPETNRKAAQGKIARQSSVTHKKNITVKPKPPSAKAASSTSPAIVSSAYNIYKVPRKLSSHTQEHLPNQRRPQTSIQLNNHLPKPTTKPLAKYKRSLPESQANKTGHSNSPNSNSNLEDLLAALQVKPASKHLPNNNKLKVFRSFKDRSTLKGVESLTEITTMVSDVSPVLSDIEVSEQSNSWAAPIIGPSGYTHKSNYSKVLRPAFLGRSTSQASSRVSSAKSTKSISPTPSPDMTILNEDNLDLYGNPNELETMHTPVEDVAEFLPNFTIPTIVIDPLLDANSEMAEESFNDETSLIEVNSSEDCKALNKYSSPTPRELLKQEGVCNSLHQKLKQNGVDISIETLQRALMTPTEFRMVHHARRAQSCILSSRTVRIILHLQPTC